MSNLLPLSLLHASFVQFIKLDSASQFNLKKASSKLHIIKFASYFLRTSETLPLISIPVKSRWCQFSIPAQFHGNVSGHRCRHSKFPRFAIGGWEHRAAADGHGEHFSIPGASRHSTEAKRASMSTQTQQNSLNLFVFFLLISFIFLHHIIHQFSRPPHQSTLPKARLSCSLCFFSFSSNWLLFRSCAAVKDCPGSFSYSWINFA